MRWSWREGGRRREGGKESEGGQKRINERAGDAEQEERRGALAIFRVNRQNDVEDVVVECAKASEPRQGRMLLACMRGVRCQCHPSSWTTPSIESEDRIESSPELGIGAEKRDASSHE